MKEVLYSSPYVPAEWIAAHGLKPVRQAPQKTDRVHAALERQGVCTFVRSFASQAMARQDVCAIVMTTACDQMRRTFDIVSSAAKVPAFLMNVPSTCGTSAMQLYLSELKRLGDFLVNCGGSSPSDKHLAEVMLEYEKSREAEIAIPQNVSIPIALVGGPLREQDYAIFDIVEKFGARIILDATETGEVVLPRMFNEKLVRTQPLVELADAYFTGIHDISRRPNDYFYQWLTEKIGKLHVQAIIVYRYLWCDIWHAEVQRLKQCIDLPVLDLDTDDSETFDSNRNRTRIGAFMEMLV